MVTIDSKTNTGYYYGDKIILTGESFKIYGGIFHKAVIKEGHRKGEIVDVVVKNEKVI